MKKIFTGVVLLLFLVSPLSAFGATTFSRILSFGDSLTDNGNFNFGTNTDPADLHGLMYFTDGAVWVETLAGTMNSSLYDAAYGGATTGYDNPAASALGMGETGLQWQLENAFPDENLSDTLITAWAGANDFFNGRDVSSAAANMDTALDKLKTAGATSILVPNLPDIGLTPAFYNDVNPDATQAEASGWTLGFNNQLYGVLETFAGLNPEIDIYFLDTYSLFSDLILMDDGQINPVYWSLMFWDGVHPTSLGHALLAGEAYEVLQAGPMTVPTPVPAGIWLLGTGLIGLIGIRRKTRHGLPD